jgi:hypothetical protein
MKYLIVAVLLIASCKHDKVTLKKITYEAYSSSQMKITYLGLKGEETAIVQDSFKLEFFSNKDVPDYYLKSITQASPMVFSYARVMVDQYLAKEQYCQGNCTIELKN